MAEENTKSYEKLSDLCWRASHDRDMAIGIHFAISARNHLHNNVTCSQQDIDCSWVCLSFPLCAEEMDLTD
ncbi:hypothetical protein L6452_02409 [Arctium lappa]|uniref:Uncharacterized protein n=1 Tax=Arctium lappa TaxID=4217 RepID=A0ACB9FIR8_ARCLA|nr:hypothetical protein L6452_02409 [Arctium lappa]